MSAHSIVCAHERDPFDARYALGASGLLREFNRAGVLAAADVHVARELARIGGEPDEAVALAVALAVRGPRLGHVHVDLAAIRDTAAVDADEPVDLSALPWPDPPEWVRRVGASPLVTVEDPLSGAGTQPAGAGGAGPPPAGGGGAGSPPAGAGGAAGGLGGDADVRPLRLAGAWLYLDRYWREEVRVAEALRELAGEPVSGVDGDLLADGLARLFGADDRDDAQRRAAVAAVSRRLAVVAGGPGTGKTTTVARIVALIYEQAAAVAQRAPGGELRLPLVALAAPTGKAAARLQEAVHAEAESLDVAPPIREALRALPASTIHRLLGWRSGSSSRFRHDRNQRLPHDVVIVDETSMVALSLMARLIEALRTGARLTLVGDPGQLASIEAGAVLGDIVGPHRDGAPSLGDTNGPARDSGDRARAPGIVVLDRVHRFGGGIAQLAAAIRAGREDEVIALLRDPPADVTWLEADVAPGDPPAEVREPALAAARSTLSAARNGRPGEALAALGSFRILCAHRRGPQGVATWSAVMEGWLAASGEIDPGDRWYVGRPLLVTENDYELHLSNGDTGVIVAAGEARVTAAFALGGEIVEHSPSRLGAVETVYAMTIHKSQGSQFDAAAVLLPDPESRLLSRELLYTAVTRARHRIILVGSEATVRGAVGRPAARASGLGARLWGDRRG